MKKDELIAFILRGYFIDTPFGTVTTRNSLVNTKGINEGINRKNGTYEMLRSKNIIYYLGNGTRGNLQGVRIYNLLPIKFEYKILLELLQANNIAFQFEKDIFKLENGIKIYFDKNQKYIKEIIKSDNQIIENKMLAVI